MPRNSVIRFTAAVDGRFAWSTAFEAFGERSSSFASQRTTSVANLLANHPPRVILSAIMNRWPRLSKRSWLAARPRPSNPVVRSAQTNIRNSGLLQTMIPDAGLPIHADAEGGNQRESPVPRWPEEVYLLS